MFLLIFIQCDFLNWASDVFFMLTTYLVSLHGNEMKWNGDDIITWVLETRYKWSEQGLFFSSSLPVCYCFKKKKLSKTDPSWARRWCKSLRVGMESGPTEPQCSGHLWRKHIYLYVHACVPTCVYVCVTEHVFVWRWKHVCSVCLCLLPPASNGDHVWSQQCRHTKTCLPPHLHPPSPPCTVRINLCVHACRHADTRAQICTQSVLQSAS